MFEGAAPILLISLPYFRKGELRAVWRGVRGGRANVPAKSAEIREGYLNVESHPSFEVRPLAIFPQSLPSNFEYRALQHVSILKSTWATTWHLFMLQTVPLSRCIFFCIAIPQCWSGHRAKKSRCSKKGVARISATDVSLSCWIALEPKHLSIESHRNITPTFWSNGNVGGAGAFDSDITFASTKGQC